MCYICDLFGQNFALHQINQAIVTPLNNMIFTDFSNFHIKYYKNTVNKEVKWMFVRLKWVKNCFTLTAVNTPELYRGWFPIIPHKCFVPCQFHPLHSSHLNKINERLKTKF